MCLDLCESEEEGYLIQQLVKGPSFRVWGTHSAEGCAG